jgi:hypothetical protein
MIIELIIIIFGMLSATALGFYFGYLKREDKAPELPELKPFHRFTLKGKKQDKTEQFGFYGQKIEGE